MKVVVTAEAQHQIRAARRWWRAHRDAKQAFTDELRETLDVLSRAPKYEVYGCFGGEPVRRFLLEKARCHMYYLIDRPAEVVRIVALWGANRSSGPSEIEPR